MTQPPPTAPPIVPPPAPQPPPASTAPAAQPAAPADPGFPANTPLEQMNADQREAYWRHYARKHEDRAKAFGNLTPEQLTELREKAEKHDALELELGTTAEKAAAKAAQEAKDAARGEYQPALITAKLDAAAARAGVSEEDLAKAVEFVDTTKFLAADGTVDTDKVQAFIATITPAKGTPPPPGPSSRGQGHRGTSTPGVGSVAAGRDLYAETHAKK
jgi:hypothetical protein